jgi:membrane protein
MSQPSLATTVRLTVAAYRSHNASRFGAALAFYIVFCVAPLLLTAIALTGAVVGQDVAQQFVLDRLGSSVGTAATTAIASMIREASAPRVGWLATTLGFTSLYFGMTGVYRQIDDALRTIWEEPPPRTLARRVASIVVVAATGLVVVVSIVADAIIAATGRYASSRLVGGEPLWHVVQLIVSALVLTILFAVVFRSLAASRATWRDVALGAAVTSVLFVAGKFALGLYLGKAAVGSAFGAAGSVVVVLLWSYWSAQIFFFGLEFTHVHAQHRD